MSIKSVLRLSNKSKDAIAFSQSKESKVLSEANELKLNIQLDYIEACSKREDFMKELTAFIEEKNEIIKFTKLLEDKEKKRKLETLNYKIRILNNNLRENKKYIDYIEKFVRENYSINNNHFIKEIFDAIKRRTKQDADKTILENLKRAIQLNKKIEEAAGINSINKNRVNVLCTKDSDCKNFNQICKDFVCREIQELELDVKPSRSTKEFKKEYLASAMRGRDLRRKELRRTERFDPLYQFANF